MHDMECNNKPPFLIHKVLLHIMEMGLYYLRVIEYCSFVFLITLSWLSEKKPSE